MTAISCGCRFDDSVLCASDIGAEQFRQRAAETQFSWSHTRHAIGAACSASRYVSNGICARWVMAGKDQRSEGQDGCLIESLEAVRRVVRGVRPLRADVLVHRSFLG